MLLELYIDGSWVDFGPSGSRRVRADGVAIKRGGADESPRVSYGTATLEFNDTANDLSGVNPNSPYYNKIGIGTPLRVTAAGEVRHIGEITSYEPVTDTSDNLRIVKVVSSGILARLAQGTKALKPALERSTLFRAPFAYWPMNDGRNTAIFGNAVAGQLPMSVSSLIVPGSVTGPDGSTASLPELVNADIVTSTEAGQGSVVGSTGSSWTLDLVHKAVDDGTGTAESTPWTWFTAHMGFELVLANGGNSVTLTATDLDGSGADITLVGSVTTPVDSAWHQYRVTCSYSSPNTTLTLYRDGTSLDSDTAAGSSGDFDDIHPMAEPPAAISHLSSSSTGHATLYAGTSVTATTAAVSGHTGETVGARMTRICAEEGITFALVGVDYAGHTCGPQAADKLYTILSQAADVGQGILYETRDVLGLTYRTITSLYNQVATLALDYSASQVHPPFLPAYDNQRIQNTVTTSRPSGGSVTATRDTGRLSTQDPPDGVGVYDRGGGTVYCETDDQLGPIAYWLVHLGTWDGYRYPSLAVFLESTAYTGSATLTAATRALDVGLTATISNGRAGLREVDPLVRLQTRGYTETITTFTWRIAFNMIPGWPWEVEPIETGGSTLALAVNSSATSLKLDTSLGPPWSTTNEPYHIRIGGEAMTVTAMTTDSPAFIAAGTVAHGNNASVVPGLPAGMTVDSAQLMICLAAIRNSGTGTVNVPSGWTSIVDFGNMRLFGRYYVTGDTAPTVTFTGGVANADTSARIVAFSGLSMQIDGSAQTLLNSSAQDIAYSALVADTATQGAARRTNHVVLLAAWKQDDWTSVAPASGFTEDVDNATTTGDDQAIMLDHRIDTTAAAVAAGSITVTGGASAISRSIVVALRPLQTATVTRSVNSVSASHAVGDAVTSWRLGVIAL